MRRLLIVALILVQSFFLMGCAAMWQSVAYTDDLYSVHDKIAIANREKAEAELAKAQYEAQKAQYEAALVKANAEAAKQNYTIGGEESFNGFDAVLADSYDSAYARRLYGFSSPTYRMPSSYYTWRYSDAFFYASAYDPAFYNVVVSGDMVWVEPKYVTSMFGSWGATVIPSYGWYYGWNDPFYYWSNPYRYNYGYYYGWNYGWNSSYWWNWGYPYSHYYHHHHYGNHYHPHRPSYHRPSHHHPPHTGSGSVGNTGHHHGNRPGSVVGRNPGATTPADRGGNRGGYTPSKPSSSSADRSQPTFRGVGGSMNSANGSSSYRGGSTNVSDNSGSRGASGVSTSKPSTPSVGRTTRPTYRSGGTSSSKSTSGSSSYRSGSSSSSSSSKPSYGSGSSSSSRSYSSPSSSRSYSSPSSSSSFSNSSPSYSGGGGNSRGR